MKSKLPPVNLALAPLQLLLLLIFGVVFPSTLLPLSFFSRKLLRNITDRTLVRPSAARSQHRRSPPTHTPTFTANPQLAPSPSQPANCLLSLGSTERRARATYRRAEKKRAPLARERVCQNSTPKSIHIPRTKNGAWSHLAKSNHTLV